MWCFTLGLIDKSSFGASGEQHKLIEPDIFEADTPLGFSSVAAVDGACSC